MKDWAAIARANGIEISARELERIAIPLAALEEAFRPMVKGLSPEIEPAFGFHIEEAE